VSKDFSLPHWITYLFDHPVPYDWSEDSAEWHDSSVHVVELIAESFERSDEFLARFSDSQLDQAFHFLLDAGGSEFMFSLVLGHWSFEYPGVANIIDEFLSCTPDLRSELVAYAKSAKTGVL